MKRLARTTLLLLCLLVTPAGAAHAQSDFAILESEIDLVFKHGFEVVGAIDCGARPPPAATRIRFNGISHGSYFHTGDMHSYLDIVGLKPPTGSGPPSFVPFPGNGANHTMTWSFPPSSYAAMEFAVPQTLSSSSVFQFQFFQTAFLPQNAVASMSLTECPGDFHPSVLPTCKAQWDGNDGGLILMVADNSPLPASAACRITRGKTYYLNFVGAELASPSSTTCQSIGCRMGVIAILLSP